MGSGVDKLGVSLTLSGVIGQPGGAGKPALTCCMEEDTDLCRQCRVLVVADLGHHTDHKPNP